jgi:hypothetical protein
VRSVRNADLEIVLNANLARKAELFDHFRCFERFDLCLANRRNVALENFDPARGANGLSAAAMQYVNSGVFYTEYELFSKRRLEGLFSFDGDLGHAILLNSACPAECR